MTTPEPPPFDTGNPLLSGQPAQMQTSLMQTPAGQQMAVTIRTPSATLTVFLAKADADTWARNLKATADAMSGSGLIVAAPGSNGLAANGKPG